MPLQPHREPLPPEIVDLIVDAAWGLGTPAWCEVESPRALASLSSISYTFYVSARKRLWNQIFIRYYPFRTRPNKRNDRLYEVLCQNPELQSDIRSVSFRVYKDVPDFAPEAKGYHNDDEEAKEMTHPSVHEGLSRSLCLLSMAKVETLEVFVETKRLVSTAGSFNTKVDSLPNEILFALTALRTSPTLRSFTLEYTEQPPPSLIFGNPRTDAVEDVTLNLVLLPPLSPVRDYTIPASSPSLELLPDHYSSVTQAIAYFTSILPPSFPLFPHVKRLKYSTLGTSTCLTTYLRGFPVIDPSKPFGGHIPSLDGLDFTDWHWDGSTGKALAKDFIYTAAPMLRDFHFHDTPEHISSPVKSLATFRSLTTFRYTAPLPELMLGEYEDIEPKSLQKLFTILLSISPTQPLRTIVLDLSLYAETGLLCTRVFEQEEMWGALDDHFFGVANLLTPRKLTIKILLTLISPLDTASSDWVDDIGGLSRLTDRSTEDLVRLLPKSRDHDLIDLHMNFMYEPYEY